MLPPLKSYNKELEEDTRRTVMRLAAQYRKLGIEQSQAMRMAWQQVKAEQDGALQNAQWMLHRMTGIFGGLSQVFAVLKESLRRFAWAVAGIFGAKMPQQIEQLEESGKKAAKGQQILTKSMKKTAKAAVKTVLSIDELNVLQRQSGGSAGGGSSGGHISAELPEIEPAPWPNFLELFQKLLERLKELFEPSIIAWRKAFWQLGEAGKQAWKKIQDSAMELWQTALVPLGKYLFEEFVPNIVNAFSETIAPIVADVGSLFLHEFAENFVLGCTIIGDFINSYVVPILKFLETMVQDMLGRISEAWQIYGEPILERLKQFGEQLRDMVKLVYYEVIKPILDDLVQHLSVLWNESLKPLWDNLMLLFGSVCEMILILWTEHVMPLLKKLGEIFAPILTQIMKFVEQRFFGLLKTVSGVMNGITKALRGLCEFVSGVFTGDWSRAWNGLKDVFGGIWDGMLEISKGSVNGIIDTVNGMIRAVTGGLNAVIDQMNRISVDIPEWVPMFGGKHFGINIPHVPDYQIPRLAKGAVLPANKPFLAMVGDQKHGTNVEAPLDTITQAVVAALAQLGASQEFTASQPIEVKLDGQVLYRAMANIKANRGIQIGGAFANAY